VLFWPFLALVFVVALSLAARRRMWEDTAGGLCSGAQEMATNFKTWLFRPRGITWCKCNEFFGMDVGPLQPMTSDQMRGRLARLHGRHAAAT
jgi:hypothetical protein